MEKHTYKPLPKTLTIKKSPIHGMGLFATSDIKNNTILGVSHVKADPFFTNFKNNLIRTPLGGWINHSLESNVIIKINQHSECYNLITIKDISMGDEIVINYISSPCGVGANF